MRLLAASLVVAALPIVVAPPVSEAGTQNASATCAGLRVEKSDGSVKVSRLRTTHGVSCATARGVARQVAADLLRKRKVPQRISGFRIVVVRPCQGCSPHYSVTASGKSGRVTFVADGGA